jgi:hypothetical protein
MYLCLIVELPQKPTATEWFKCLYYGCRDKFNKNGSKRNLENQSNLYSSHKHTWKISMTLQWRSQMFWATFNIIRAHITSFVQQSQSSLTSLLSSYWLLENFHEMG